MKIAVNVGITRAYVGRGKSIVVDHSGISNTQTHIEVEIFPINTYTECIDR